jgi:Trk K+ transport system NAD-binding subunit
MTTTRSTEAETTDGIAEHVVVVGGDHFGLAIAEYLVGEGRSVTFVSETELPGVVDGVAFIHREITAASDVRALGLELADADVVVVVGIDSEALVTGYLVRQELNPRTVVAGLSDPSNCPAFEGTGIERIDVPRLLADRIHDQHL